MFGTNLLQSQPQNQQGPPPLPNDEQIEEMVTDLSKELSLSEEKEKVISSLYFDYFEEMSAMLGENKNSRPNRDVMEQMKKDFETDVKSNLTKEQKKLFTSYQKKQEANRGGQGRPSR